MTYGSGRERSYLRGRLGKTRIAAFGAHRQTFGIDELHVPHAEKSEKVAHVTRLGIERRPRIEPAPGREDIDLLAREKTHRSSGAVLERHPRAGDVVEIRFELRGYAEVVHGQADDDDIGSSQLIDQRIGIGDDRVLRVNALLRLGDEGGE